MSIRAVHHLNCATTCPFGFLTGRPFQRYGKLVSHCLLLVTERDGLVLVDTGFGTRDVETKTALPVAFRMLIRPRFDRSETALAQIEALGFAAADVRHIIVTHLDFDHAGGLSDFPAARVHIHAREHAAATAPTSSGDRVRYARRHWLHRPQWELYREDGDSWRGLPAVTRLRGLDADLALVPLHGHSAGHSAVVVRDRERWLVHAGDAYFHRAELTGGRAPLGLAGFARLVQTHAANRRASLGALRQLRAAYDDVAIFCSHDAHELASFRSASRT